MHLLDTDTLTHLHAGHPQVIAHLRAVDEPSGWNDRYHEK